MTPEEWAESASKKESDEFYVELAAALLQVRSDVRKTTAGGGVVIKGREIVFSEGERSVFVGRGPHEDAAGGEAVFLRFENRAGAAVVITWLAMSPRAAEALRDLLADDTEKGEPKTFHRREPGEAIVWVLATEPEQTETAP